MSQIKNIFIKEFNDYFVSPIAYIIITIFLLTIGVLFFSTFIASNQASMRGFFNLLPLIFSLVIPAVTMRLFSEEFNIGSYEILSTLPVTSVEIVLAKFFSALAFIVAMLLPTLIYPITISFLGELDWGPVMGGYLGALFLGGAFSAIGLFTSSITKNQIIAFILGITICFTLFLIGNMLFLIPKSMVAFFSYLGTGSHFESISKGVIDSRDILYFLSIIFIGLYGTNLVIQEKR